MTTGWDPVGALAALPVGRLQKAEVTSGVHGSHPPLAAGRPGTGCPATQQGLRQESLDHLGLSIFEPHRMEKEFEASCLGINSVRGGHGKQQPGCVFPITAALKYLSS